MRLSGLLLVICSFHLLADNSYSQNARLSLDLKYVTVDQVLSEIENQSEFYFLYNNKLIDVNRKVNIYAVNKPIKDILNGLFAGSNVDYVLIDRQIVLSPGEYLAEAKLKLQPRTITGTVVDENGEPLPGVAVVIKETTIGTLTDVDGKYSIEVDGPEAVLVLSFVGTQTQEITVGNRNQINVTMVIEVTALGDVVVTGYGTRLKEQLTGAVSTVSEDKMEISTEPTVMGRIQGHVSGVDIQSAHIPGASSTIRIRGIGTINDPDPLYIIDGVPAGPGNDLNPGDIESISILKDASSAAIYGTRGANGVVIITTKRGSTNQRPSVNLRVKSGVTHAINQYDMLNTQEYAEAVWLSYDNRGVAPAHAQFGSGSTPVIPDYILPAGAMEGDPGTDPSLYSYPDHLIFKANKEGTDWYDEIYQYGVIQEYDLSVTGGGQNATYAFSGNYLDEDGLLKYTNFKRYSFRMNSDANMAEWLKVGETLQVSYSKRSGLSGDNSEGSAISDAYRLQPIVPVYDISGELGHFAGSVAPEMGNGENAVANLYRGRLRDSRGYRIIGSVFGEITVLDRFKLKSLLGYNYDQGLSKSYRLPSWEYYVSNEVEGYSESRSNSFQWNWSNTLTYNETFADVHTVNVILGTEAIESIYENMSASRDEYFSIDPLYMQLSSGELNKDNSGGGSEWALFSLFGRVNYDLMDRYFLEVTVRRDGSSRFSEENRYGNFPAASFAWAVSRESFMAATRAWLDLLKLRIGWGLSGNDRIGNYNSYTTFATHSHRAAYDIGGTNTITIIGFMPDDLGNKNVTWEATETLNFGVDGAVMNNKLNFAFDVWQRNTTDMLYRLRIPDVVGLATAPYVNIGEMKNTGVDVELGYADQAFGGKFRYGVKATFSHYKNEIVKLSEDVEEEIIAGSLRQINYTRAAVGTAFPEFYGYEVEGIFQTQAEADAWPTAIGADGTYNQPGHFKYKDQLTVDTDGDGVPDAKDGVITADDMTYIGNPHPDFTGGLNIDLGYGNFNLNMFFYGSYGNEMVNYVRRWIDYGMFYGGLSHNALYESWGSPYLDNNEDATLPMFDYDNNSQQASTHFVEDASFLRLKTMRLDYSVPNNFLSRLNIRSLRLYAQVTNLFTLTKYSGLDPEVRSSGSSKGLDQGAWPTPRQILFGINLGL